MRTGRFLHSHFFLSSFASINICKNSETAVTVVVYKIHTNGRKSKSVSVTQMHVIEMPDYFNSLELWLATLTSEKTYKGQRQHDSRYLATK